MKPCDTAVHGRNITDPCDACFHTLAVHKIGRARPVRAAGSLVLVDEELVLQCSVCELLEDLRDEVLTVAEEMTG